MNTPPTETFESVVDELVTEIDAALAVRGTSLSQRPHQAAVFIAEHCVIEIKGDTKEGYLVKPWFGAILAEVVKWYKRIYGQALSSRNSDLQLAAVLILQTPFALRIPMTKRSPISGDNSFWLSFPINVHPDELPIGWLVDPPNLAVLSRLDHDSLLADVQVTVENLRQISNRLMTANHLDDKCRRHAGLILPHLEKSAIDLIAQEPRNRSTAVWEAVFAAEQAIKCLLRQHKTISTPNIHDVAELHALRPFTDGDENLAAAVALMPSGRNAVKHRYTELPSPTVSLAMQVYRASQVICREYALRLPRKIVMKNASIHLRVPPMP